MELPAKVHPSLKAWKYIKAYSFWGLIALLSIGGIIIVQFDLFSVSSRLSFADPLFTMLPVTASTVLSGLFAVILLAALGKILWIEVMDRRFTSYVFYDDRFVIQRGYEFLTLEFEEDDIPYELITHVDVLERFQGVFYLGRLKIIMAGYEEPLIIDNLPYPDIHAYQALLLGEDAEDIDMDELGRHASHNDEGRKAPEDVEEELSELRQRYEDGIIGRAEYEEEYYRLRGELEELEREEEVDEKERERWEGKEEEDIKREMDRVEQEYEAGRISREDYERQYYFLKGELEMVEDGS